MWEVNTIILCFIVAISAVGIGELIWGMMTVRNPPRSQQALDRWLKRMKTAGAQYIPPQHIIGDQFDQETLAALARYQRRVQGTILSGMGGGIFLGSIAALGLFEVLQRVYANRSDPVSIFFPLYSCMGLGVIIGIGVSACISATTGPRMLRTALPTTARRLSNYRSLWFFLVSCLVFLLSAVLPALILTNTAPRSLYTDTLYGQKPLLGLLILAPGLIGAIILLAEGVSRLLVHCPLPASDLPPAVEAQLLAYLPSFGISQVWGIFSMICVSMLLESEAIAVPVFPLMLLATALGIPYMLIGVMHAAWRTQAAQAPMYNAIALAAKPQQNAEE